MKTLSSADLWNRNLKTIPKIFDGIIVTGNFIVSNNLLTSLENSPSEAETYDCSKNKLKSLKGGPARVHSDFDCSYNRLDSLDGIPKNVGGDFIALGPRRFEESDIRKLCKVEGRVILSPLGRLYQKALNST